MTLFLPLKLKEEELYNYRQARKKSLEDVSLLWWNTSNPTCRESPGAEASAVANENLPGRLSWSHYQGKMMSRENDLTEYISW